MIDNLIKDIAAMHENRFERLKAVDQPRVGWLSILTPEEILYAAGAIPYRITGETRPDIARAGALMHRNICPYVLSCLEEAADGVHDFSDGVVIANACDARRSMYDVWRYYLDADFVHLLDAPKHVNASTKAGFVREIRYLMETLERRYDREITSDDLAAAISLCNETRLLLQRLWDLRKRDTPPITGVQALDIVRAGMTGPRREYNEKLSRLVDRLSASPDADSDKNRVLLTGGFFDHAHIVEMIEQMDAVVVCEDLSNGVKYFEGSVDEAGEPVAALADYYLDKATCARMIDSEKRFDHMWRLIEDYYVDSVIYVSLKFCDSNLIDYYYQKKRLAEKDVPVLFIETERTPTNIGQLRTRIQAFLESASWF